MAKFTIYLHRNRVTGKAYVGQTGRTMQKRWLEHVKNAGKEGRGCRLMSAAIRKHGADSFDHDVLATVETQSEADALEAKQIELHGTLTPNGYNLDSGRYCGEGRSFHHSEESKRLMSDKAKLRESRMSPEEKTLRRFGTSTAEDRSEVAKKRWASLTTDQLKELRKKLSVGLSSSERNTAAIRARWAKLTLEQRSEHSKKAHDAQNADQRRERGKKAWATFVARKITKEATKNVS